MYKIFLSLVLSLNWIIISTVAVSAAPTSSVSSSLPIPSSRAQQLYKSASNDLLQIRVLLKNGRTQSSVGSGFLIGETNLVLTNYHVVSQIVMHPENYIGQFIDTAGVSGEIKLIAVDVLHDLAVVQISRKGTGFFKITEVPVLSQGQYLYSMGNPLDLGFAISEGTYNGVIRRGFYDQFMFTGAINSGMSGGPNITETGQVAGVNVSKRLDGELVSFLVPAKYAKALLEKANNKLSAKVTEKAPSEVTYKEQVGEQLLLHQDVMFKKLLSKPFTLKNLGDYRVPVRESQQVRCWGGSDNGQEKSYELSTIYCSMESSIFVTEELQVGYVSIRHQHVKVKTLGNLRFSALQSRSFENEQFGGDKDKNITAPMCKEQFISNNKLSLRAILCVTAYREFKDLYNFSLLTATTDQSLESLQSRLNISGVNYENGLQISTAFLNSLARKDSTSEKARK